MKTLSLFALAAVLGMGTASMLRTHNHNQFAGLTQTDAQTTDAAFRDGLYLGRLAAKSGAQPHVAVGRWAAAQDRSSFTAGYQQGYSEFLASRANTPGPRAD